MACLNSSRCRHFDKLSANLMQLKNSKTHTDLTLVVRDVRFPCHKVILSASSTYFSAMFQSGMKEADSGEVGLEFCEPETMDVLLDYFYSGDIDVSQENAQALVEASDHLNLVEVKLQCESFMVEQTDSDNCIGFARFAEAHHLINLSRVAQDCTLDHFEDVMMKSEEFLGMSEEELTRLISDDRLRVQDEDMAFCAVKKWVEGDCTSRKEGFARIAPHVRLTFCSKDFLRRLLYGEPLLTTVECSTLLKHAIIAVYSTLPDNQEPFHFPGWHPRLSYASRFLKTRLMCVFGESATLKVAEFVEESKSSNKWSLCDPATMREPVFWACRDNGFVRNIYQNKTRSGVCCFEEPDTPTPLISDIRGFQSCILYQNKLIVFGSGGVLDSVVAHDLADTEGKNWTSLAPMLTAPHLPQAVSLGHAIYVIDGGESGNCKECTRATQIYDPMLNQWKRASQMPLVCSGGTAVVLNQKIYVFGGNILSAMCYDPLTNKWTVLSPPCFTHCTTKTPATSVVWKGKILVSGGGCVEEYDPETDSWKVRPELALQDHYFLFTSTPSD